MPFTSLRMRLLVSLSYGAVGDGQTNDAAAIQKAIDACFQAGGGRVILENGRTYYSSSIILKAHTELHLERGAVLKAHQDIDTYFHPNAGQRDDGVDRVGTPVTLKPSYAFIYAKDADDIAISGPGVVDGNAYAFVKHIADHIQEPKMINNNSGNLTPDQLKTFTELLEKSGVEVVSSVYCDYKFPEDNNFKITILFKKKVRK